LGIARWWMRASRAIGGVKFNIISINNSNKMAIKRIVTNRWCDTWLLFIAMC
jgi:hypothetical protein